MAGTWYDTLAAFDLETTGVDVRSAKIVSACLARLDSEGHVTERLDWLVDPGEPIPPRATEVHGITDARVQAEGTKALVAVPEIVAAVQAVFDAGIGLVIYNAPYDLSVLAAEARRHGLPPIVGPAPVVDPIILDKQVDRYRRGKRTLDLTTSFYGVPLEDAHDAGADAIAAARLAQAIGRKYPDQLDGDVAAIHAAQVGWAAAQQADFARYMREKVNPDWVSDRSDWPGGQ